MKKIRKMFFVACAVSLLNSCTNVTSFVDRKMGFEPVKVNLSAKPKTHITLYAKVPNHVVNEVEQTVSLQCDLYREKNGKQKSPEDLHLMISKAFEEKGYKLKPAMLGYRSGVFVVMDYKLLYQTY